MSGKPGTSCSRSDVRTFCSAFPQKPWPRASKRRRARRRAAPALEGSGLFFASAGRFWKPTFDDGDAEARSETRRTGPQVAAGCVGLGAGASPESRESFASGSGSGEGNLIERFVLCVLSADQPSGGSTSGEPGPSSSGTSSDSSSSSGGDSDEALSLTQPLPRSSAETAGARAGLHAHARQQASGFLSHRRIAPALVALSLRAGRRASFTASENPVNLVAQRRPIAMA